MTLGLFVPRSFVYELEVFTMAFVKTEVQGAVEIITIDRRDRTGFGLLPYRLVTYHHDIVESMIGRIQFNDHTITRKNLLFFHTDVGNNQSSRCPGRDLDCKLTVRVGNSRSIRALHQDRRTDNRLVILCRQHRTGDTRLSHR